LSFTDSKQPSASQVVIESDRGGDSSVVALSDSNLSLSDNMKPWDSDLLKPSFGAMGALNGALNEAGVRLIVRNGVQLDKPIEIVNIATGDGNDDPFAQFPALKIEVGHSGSVKIMERFLTPDPQLLYFTCARTSIVAGANSAIDFLKVQEEGCNARHWHGTEVVLERDARCCVTTVNFGSRLARNEVIGHVAGDNSHLKLYGLTIGGSEQHIDNNTTIDHLVPHCDSTELYKGVYAGASTGVFGGTIIVRQAAQKTNAMQSNNAVLLSSQATYNTRPCLKIWADDVKCSHGATVGQLDEEAIFYLMSRGVPRNQARTMVTEAFACSTLEGLSDVMRAWIAPRVKSRLAEV
jgi:Fe-S cluster assembly protein SufD